MSLRSIYRSISTTTVIHGSLLFSMIALGLLQPESGHYLSLHRVKTVSEGEWWRLITGHLVHLSWPHTLLNCTGLLLITLIFSTKPKPPSPSPSHTTVTCPTHPHQPLITPLHLLSFYFISSLSVSLLILLFSDDIGNYFGLSGILYGLVVFYLMADLKQNKIFSLLALTLFCGKVAFDQLNPEQSQSTAELIGGPVASDAHLFGVLTGLLYGLWLLVLAHIHDKRAATS